MRTLLVSTTVNKIGNDASETLSLLHTLDLEVISTISFNLKDINKATFVGKGAMEIIKNTAKELQIELVVFDNNLSPLQYRNISSILEIEVFDRAMIIIEIFQRRAKTYEAQLEVEIASLKYSLARLVDSKKNYDQVSGSLYNKGSGEKLINLQKRRIRTFIDNKEKKLKEIQTHRELTRKNRSIPQVSLVGYTNAGKSTLMNLLINKSLTTKKETVLEEDKLFATLSTTTRLIETNNRIPFLVTDTVGFISNLPNDLFKSFRSTFEEVKEADILLIVIDYSDPDYQNKLQVVKDNLKDYQKEDAKILYVYNKLDLVNHSFCSSSLDDEIYISLKEDNIDIILEKIDSLLKDDYLELELFIPYDKTNIFYQIKKEEHLVSFEELDEGYHLIVRISKNKYNQYKDYLFKN